MSKLSVTVEGYSFEIEVSLSPENRSEVIALVDGKPVRVVTPDLERPSGGVELFVVDGRPYEVTLDHDLSWIRSPWGVHSLEIADLETTQPRPHLGNGRIKAPIPGQITQVMISIGDEVQVGQPLFILEAMKMENAIRSPKAGIVKSVNVALGQRVMLREVLAEIE
jgi:biotin carboxyl carrier protein